MRSRNSFDWTTVGHEFGVVKNNMCRRDRFIKVASLNSAVTFASSTELCKEKQQIDHVQRGKLANKGNKFPLCKFSGPNAEEISTSSTKRGLSSSFH